MTPQHSALGTPPTKPRMSGIAIAVAIVGGIVLLVMGASAAFALAASSQRAGEAPGSERPLVPLDATGVTGLDLNVGLADLTLAFADVQEATLVATGGLAKGWEFTRDEDELTVRAPQANSGFCFFGVCPTTRGQNVTATLTLPQELAGPTFDAEIKIGMGVLRANGSFGELDVKLDAGDAFISGAAEHLDLEIGLGTFAGEITGAKTVAGEVAMGDLELVLRGEAPSEVDLEVSAGSIDIAVPAGEYDVTSTNTAGSIDNSLRTVPGAPNRITAKVDMGDIALRESR